MSERTILPMPGISILAVDPGSCTGWALFDGVTGALYYDQWYGERGPDSNLTFKHINVAQAAVSVMHTRELNIARRLADFVQVLGPHCVVVFEDFILGASSGGRGGYGGRAGLSPVRIIAGFEAIWAERGIGEGDAWRVWNCGLLGIDGRGLHVASVAAADYWSNGFAARMRMNRFSEGSYGSDGAKMAAFQGASIKSSTPCNDEGLKRAGMWVPGKPHARDAMRHLRYFARGLGLRINAKPELYRAVARNHKYPEWMTGS